MRHCRTAREVVDALGGVIAVRELTGANIKAIYYWTGRARKFPANQHQTMLDALKRKKAKAPHWLWAQNNYKPPPDAKRLAA
jgi:hypothetical protein